MNDRLEQDERETLIRIIRVLYSNDESLEHYNNSYNAETVLIVETIITEQEKCNAAMKTLVTELIGGTAYMTKGWFRAVLKKADTILNRDIIKFNGAACKGFSLNNWKQSLILSTI